MRLLAPVWNESKIEGYTHWCPACQRQHYIPVPKWTFTGSINMPTFRPSLVMSIRFRDLNRKPQVCHYFVTNGKLEYQHDCTHGMASQTVPMVDLDSIWECPNCFAANDGPRQVGCRSCRPKSKR